MAKRAFLDDNKGRDYPFLKGESFTPLPTVLACGFVIGPNTGFVATQNNVALTKVKREFGRIWFYFTCDAPGLALQEIIFSRLEDSPQYALEYADSSSIVVDEDGGESVSESLSMSSSMSLSSSSSLSQSESETDTDAINVCGYIDDFSGFLITGPLDDLLNILPDNSFIEGISTVEPALLQDLSNTYIRSINLANYDRTRYVAPVGCEGDDPQGDREVFVNSTCIQGKVVFTPGTNSNISQNSFTNSITFSAVVGAGSGEPCEQIPLYEGEIPPADSMYLEGGPSCNEVIRSISGVSGPIADLSPDGGVSISYVPSEHKIIVDVNLKTLATCDAPLFVGEAAYDDCHHEAGPIGTGPGGGRGPTELTIPSLELFGLGLFSAPGERAGLGYLVLPGLITTGGGGSSGVFSTGFSGYGSLALPSFATSGDGVRPFHIFGPGVAVIPSFSLAGTGTGTFTPPPFETSGDGTGVLPLLECSGDGRYDPYVEPPPLGDDIHFAEPVILLVYVGKGGSNADTTSEASYVLRYAETICYAPPGQAAFNPEGGKGGGRGETNPWPVWYTYGLVSGVRNDGGDGALAPELDNFYRGGGGGGAAGRLGDGHHGGQPFRWNGGDGRDSAPGSYHTSGIGADSIPTLSHIATIPGGGGAGTQETSHLQNAGDGLVAFTFDYPGFSGEIVFDGPGVYELNLADYPGATGGFIECWGGGGVGGGWGAEYNGGGGSAYAKTFFFIDY